MRNSRVILLVLRGQIRLVLQVVIVLLFAFTCICLYCMLYEYVTEKESKRESFNQTKPGICKLYRNQVEIYLIEFGG